MVIVGQGSPLSYQALDLTSSATSQSGPQEQGSTPDVASQSNPHGPLLNGAGQVAKVLHWGAEELISASGLGPIFETIDKPIIHKLLWSPLAQLTGVPVDDHPPGIE